MSVDEGKVKAKAAVQAMFDRYRLLASSRPKDHMVGGLYRTTYRQRLTRARTLITKL